MPTLKLTLEYDGAAFVGWERQRNGLGVQEVLEAAFGTLAGHPVTVEGSGRTDAGVHALGQVASCVFERPMPLDKLRLALNGMTPPSVSVLRVEAVEDGFHARKSAVSKIYRYRLWNAPVPRPLQRHTSLFCPKALDGDAMHAAAQRFVGEHDFAAFAKEAALKATTVRRVLAARVRSVGSEGALHFEVAGEGFLYNMVRILTGTLIEVGEGRRDPASIDGLLARGSSGGEGAARSRAGPTVPAHGLALVSVQYAPGQWPSAFEALESPCPALPEGA